MYKQVLLIEPTSMENLAPKSNAVIVAQVPATIKQEIVSRANERGESVSLIVRELLKSSLKKTA